MLARTTRLDAGEGDQPVNLNIRYCSAAAAPRRQAHRNAARRGRQFDRRGRRGRGTRRQGTDCGMSIFRLSLRRGQPGRRDGGLIDRGDGPGVIEFHAGEQPESVDIAPARPRRLACLAFARPASRAPRTAGSRPSRWRRATRSPPGARLGRGSPRRRQRAVRCRCRRRDSGAGLTINTTRLVANGPVVIDDFILRMPAG